MLSFAQMSYSGLGLGAVAQLGERRVRNAEVGSSILLGSTKPKTRRIRDWSLCIRLRPASHFPGLPDLGRRHWCGPGSSGTR